MIQRSRRFRGVTILAIIFCVGFCLFGATTKAHASGLNTVVFTDTFNRANTSVGSAGSTSGVGNNWTDAAGGIWNINNNTLQGTTANVDGYTSNFLERPTSTAVQDQRVVATIPVNGIPVNGDIGVALRIQSNGNCYLFDVSDKNSGIYIYKIVGGLVFNLNPGGTFMTGSSTISTSHSYQVDVSAVGISPTTLSFIVTDLTTSSTVVSYSVTDSESSLQNSIGVPGFDVWAASGQLTNLYSSFTLYGSSAPIISSFSASPSSITANGTSTLSWDITNASSVTISPGNISTTTLVGSAAVSPTSTTLYTLTATNANGTSTATANVMVLPTATTYTMTGPISTVAGAASTYTITPNGIYSGVITPISSAGGTISPTSLTFSNSSAAQTFTFTPSSAGTTMISATSAPAVANPSSIMVTAIAPLISLVHAEAAELSNISTKNLTVSSTAQGDAMVCGFTWYNSATISSVVDNKNDTYTFGANAQGSGWANMNAQIWYASNIAAGVTNITVTFSGLAQGAMFCNEISGITITNPVDIQSGGIGSSGSTFSISAATTTNASDYLFAISINDSDIGTWNGADGFTTGNSYDDDTAAGSFYKIASATTTVNVVATSTSSGGGWVANMMAFKASGSTSSSAPIISSFSASPSSITANGTSTLSWDITNASSVTISPGNISTTTLVGSAAVSPTSTTLYTLTATNANGTSTATANVAIGYGALKIGWVGDSITQGGNCGDYSVNAAATDLQNYGYNVTSINKGISGTGIANWISGGADLNNAESAFASFGVTAVSVMLGTNDARTPSDAGSLPLTPAQHFAGMQGIVNSLVANGYKVILNEPIYTVPGSAFNDVVWPSNINSVYAAYWALDDTLANGTSVFIGDTKGITSMANIGELCSDGVHPSALGGNDLGGLWASGIEGALLGNTYTLSYAAGANGMITGSSTQAVAYGLNGTQVTATPNAGYHFVNWSDGVTTTARTDSDVTGAISVTANFAQTYTLAISSFSLPATSTSLTVPIASFTASGTASGYYVSASPTTPSSTNPNWLGSSPSSYIFSNGTTSATLYAWVKDSVGNISFPATASVSFPYFALSGTSTVQIFTSPNIVTSTAPSVTSTTVITFEYPVEITIGASTVSIPLGTTMTTASSSDFTTITATTSVSTTNLPTNSNVQGAVQYGFATTTISLSQPVTISIPVDSSYNGQTFQVYQSEDGGVTWTALTTCVVSSGICSFTTSNLSSFAVVAPASSPQTSPSITYSGGSGYLVTPATTSTPSVTTTTTSATTGMTISQMEALLASLESELQALEAQVAGRAVGTSSSSASYVFTRDLQLGMTGNDVKALQLFLIAQNSGPAARKLAAHGTTQNFASLTKAALIEFQKKAGITPAAGYFGAKTRAWVASH